VTSLSRQLTALVTIAKLNEEKILKKYKINKNYPKYKQTNWSKKYAKIQT